MTQTKHTPGPWEVHYGDDYTYIYGGEHDNSSNPLAITNEANARLIASAPELLVELKRITSFLEKEQARYPKTIKEMPAIEDQLIAKANVIIAKAERTE